MVLWLTPDLAVPLQQILQVLRMGLSTDVRLIDNEITTSALLCQQHTRLAPSQLVTYKMTIITTERATNRYKQNIQYKVALDYKMITVIVVITLWER